MFIWTGSTGCTLFLEEGLDVTFPRRYKDVYANGFFPRTISSLWRMIYMALSLELTDTN